MADGARADDDYEEEAGSDLPWLEPTDEEVDRAGTLDVRRILIVGGLIVLLILAALFAFTRFFGGDDIAVPVGEVPLVKAPAGPFKVEPEDRGGLQVSEAERMTSAVASGENLPSDVALDRMPEVAVPIVPPVGDRTTGSEQTAETRADTPDSNPAPAEPASPQVAQPPAPATATIQLGAFSTQAKVREVWSTFQNRYRYLGELELLVQPVEVNGTTLYRLRASVPGGEAAARELCDRLKLAGESCVIV